MFEIVKITLRGIFRDRVFQGIMALAVLFLFVPSVASLSMRQVTELSITLSLSIISFISLLLSVFLGATSIWKDIERRYTFSILSLPISRASYLIGRFLGISIFLLLVSAFLGVFAVLAIKTASGLYPPSRPLIWDTIIAAILFSALKYILVVAVAMLLSTVSTSFFLPIFGSISVFLVGMITQQVYDYLQSPSAIKNTAPIVKKGVLFVYYLMPNLSAFDLKVNAIYSIAPNFNGLLLSVIYFVVYASILLVVGVFLLERREMK